MDDNRRISTIRTYKPMRASTMHEQKENWDPTLIVLTKRVMSGPYVERTETWKFRRRSEHSAHAR